jgi:prenyltransferase beta subunit
MSLRSNATVKTKQVLYLIIIMSVFAGNRAHAQDKTWKTGLLAYIQNKLAKPDGGYGWDDQPDAHLTPTFAVTGILYDLDQLPADKHKLSDFILSHHPQSGINAEGGPSGTEMRDLVYQQIQAMLWLGGDVSSFKQKITGWKPQFNKVSNFESHGYPVFIQEMMTPVCRQLLKMPLQEISDDFDHFLQARRRANGSFNNAMTKDGGDGNILNTYWGLLAAGMLDNNSNALTKETIGWLQSCQLSSGGFTHQPNPSIGANDDVAYTWAAVKALGILSAKPNQLPDCIQYLVSLRNADGGFGRQPGLPSDPMATFYAIDALKALDAFSYLDKAKPPVAHAKKQQDFAGLKVFTVQFEASGTGSPAEAVMLADSLHIDLWGAKNENAAWIEAAQRIAKEKKVAVGFFHADEPYGKVVEVAGFGTFSHILDYIAPPQTSVEVADKADWPHFYQKTVQPLLAANGALLWQISNNEPLARVILDETVKKSGYAAISTIHFGQNFLFWVPFLQQYRNQLPFVSLQDAHGTESWWWSNELSGYRTLFLASTPTYAALMEALKKNEVVAVRHDSTNRYKTRMLGGAPGVQAYIQSKTDDWKWWDVNEGPLNRPWAAVTVLQPADSFEVARPEKGLNVRVRCRWKTTLQTLNWPLVQLEHLTVDGVEVKTEYREEKDRRGIVKDSYYLYSIEAPAAHKYVITATLKDITTSRQQVIRQEFKYR